MPHGTLLPLALWLLAAPAQAAEGPIHLRHEAGTDVPWDVGGRATLELPARLRLSATLGVMPRRYLHIIDEAVIALDGFDRQTAVLVEDALSSSLVVRAHAGWRPFPRAGLHLQGGCGWSKATTSRSTPPCTPPRPRSAGKGGSGET